MIGLFDSRGLTSSLAADDDDNDNDHHRQKSPLPSPSLTITAKFAAGVDTRSKYSFIELAAK